MVQLSPTNATLTWLKYQYDPVGNPTGRLESSGGRVTYAYDATNQLLAERRSGPGALANTFTYDALGNRPLKQTDVQRTTILPVE